MYVHDYKRAKPKHKEGVPALKGKTAPGKRRGGRGRGSRQNEGQPLSIPKTADLQPKNEGSEGEAKKKRRRPRRKKPAGETPAE
jgi:ATP-dependent RNA helicase RhlB